MKTGLNIAKNIRNFVMDTISKYLSVLNLFVGPYSFYA